MDSQTTRRTLGPPPITSFREVSLQYPMDTNTPTTISTSTPESTPDSNTTSMNLSYPTEELLPVDKNREPIPPLVDLDHLQVFPTPSLADPGQTQLVPAGFLLLETSRSNGNISTLQDNSVIDPQLLQPKPSLKRVKEEEGDEIPELQETQRASTDQFGRVKKSKSDMSVSSDSDISDSSWDDWGPPKTSIKDWVISPENKDNG